MQASRFVMVFSFLHRSRVVYSIMFFLLASALVVVARPGCMFSSDGRPKRFGVGDADSTLFSLGVTTSVIAIGSFFIFALIDDLTSR